MKRLKVRPRAICLQQLSVGGLVGTICSSIDCRTQRLTTLSILLHDVGDPGRFSHVVPSDLPLCRENRTDWIRKAFSRIQWI